VGVGVLSGLVCSLPRFARWVRLACAVATLVTVAAPAALGPAMAAVLDRLGSMHEHVCKCGMAAGKCGCPECAQDEQQRLHARGHQVASVLKSVCDQEAPAIQLATMPPTALAAASVALPVPRGERLTLDPISRPPLDRDIDPPTPPPRLASV
jgi:hypothetical protein